MIKPKIPACISDELRKGERLVWLGQPDKIWVFRLTSPLMVVALLIAIGMRHHVDLQFRGVFDLVIWFFDLVKFVPVLAFAVAPLYLCRMAAQTYYVITDQRVITVRNNSRRTYESFDLAHLSPSMRMDILGRSLVRWDAPGFHDDGEGHSTRNGVVWQAIDPKEIARMGVSFPDYRSIAGQNNIR